MSFSLSERESFNTGSYEVKLMQINTYLEGNKFIVSTWLEISQNGRKICDAYPSMTYYARSQPIRNVHIHTIWLDDIYTIFIGAESGKANLTFKTIPLVNLIWIGIVVMIVGTVIAAWPKKE
jgi:cytochrome c-type biogenesis protein CcmF